MAKDKGGHGSEKRAHFGTHSVGKHYNGEELSRNDRTEKAIRMAQTQRTITSIHQQAAALQAAQNKK
jgi:hypothetical protein